MPKKRSTGPMVEGHQRGESIGCAKCNGCGQIAIAIFDANNQPIAEVHMDDDVIRAFTTEVFELLGGRGAQ